MSTTVTVSGRTITFPSTFLMPTYAKGTFVTSGRDFTGLTLAVYAVSEAYGTALFSDEAPTIDESGNLTFAWSLRTTNVAAWASRKALNPDVWVGIWDTEAEDYLCWGKASYEIAPEPDDFTADAIEGVGASQAFVTAAVAAHAASLDNHDDVSTSGAEDGDALVWDEEAEAWVPGTPAVEVTAEGVEDAITGADAETTPADAWVFPVVVSAVLKKITWANIVTALRSLFARLETQAASVDVSGASVVADFTSTRTLRWNLVGNITSLAAPTNVPDQCCEIIATMNGNSLPVAPASGQYQGNWDVSGTYTAIYVEPFLGTYKWSAEPVEVVS